MTGDVLIHDHSMILTGATLAMYEAGELALLMRARGAAIACALVGFALITFNLLIGRPVDVAFGPSIGVAPLPAVGEADAFARLAMYQSLLIAANGYVLIAAIFRERPRIV